MEIRSDDFYNYLLTQKHVANLTAETYVRDILANEQLAERMPLTKEELINELEKVNEHRSCKSVQRIASAFHNYNDFLENKEPNLTAEQVNHLLTQPNMQSFTGTRDRAIMELLFATGIHASELIALNVGDIDIAGRTVHIRKAIKGSMERQIKISPQAMLYICTYLVRITGKTDDMPLFICHHNGKRLSRSWIWKIVRKYGIKAGIEKELSPTDLRKACAANLHQNGESLLGVQKVLGISDYQDMDDYLAEYYQRVKA